MWDVAGVSGCMLDVVICGTQRTGACARHKIGPKAESSYHSGYEKPLALKGCDVIRLYLGHAKVQQGGSRRALHMVYPMVTAI